MSEYNRKLGRFRVVVSEAGAKDYDYGHGCTFAYVNGWNVDCEVKDFALSVEELRDLRYLFDRAIAAAEDAHAGAQRAR